mgnify:CR=1 FL=1
MLKPALRKAVTDFRVSIFIQDESRMDLTHSDGKDKAREAKALQAKKAAKINNYHLCVSGFSAEDAQASKEFLAPFCHITKDRYTLSSVREKSFFNRVYKKWEKKHGIAMTVDEKVLTVWTLGKERMEVMKKKITNAYTNKILTTNTMPLQPHEFSYLKDHKWNEVENAAKLHKLLKYFVNDGRPRDFPVSPAKTPRGVGRGRSAGRGGKRPKSSKDGFGPPKPFKKEKKSEYVKSGKKKKEFMTEFRREKKDFTKQPKEEGPYLKLVGSKRGVEAVRNVVSCLLEDLRTLEFQ